MATSTGSPRPSPGPPPRAGSTQGYARPQRHLAGLRHRPGSRPGRGPGGDFDSQYLTCTSCHDPHGNENYRLLYGDEGTGPIYGGARYTFDSPAPIALGNSRRTLGNSPTGVPETDLSHTVYKSGMSEWCANCHTDLHAGNTTDFVHPTGEDMGSLVAATYNAYISTDQTSGGDPATSYRGLVPFEAVNVDLETIDPLNYTQGPTPGPGHVPDLPPLARLALRRRGPLGLHVHAPDQLAPAGDRRRRLGRRRGEQGLRLHPGDQPAVAVQQVPREGLRRRALRGRRALTR
ncbi:MAG: hypothetical protein IPM94_14040 [bacterium]|nr:hypothetical protein [bacterium]